jgi:hypothetical protein
MLTSTEGDLYLVRLDATVAGFLGNLGVEEEQISKLALANGNSKLPDGEYVLEYFFGKSFHRRVWINLGILATQQKIAPVEESKASAAGNDAS